MQTSRSSMIGLLGLPSACLREFCSDFQRCGPPCFVLRDS
jgi:hypothetical protein